MLHTKFEVSILIRAPGAHFYSPFILLQTLKFLGAIETLGGSFVGPLGGYNRDEWLLLLKILTI